jgi:hypothetical protein
MERRYARSLAAALTDGYLAHHESTLAAIMPLAKLEVRAWTKVFIDCG